MEVIHGRRSERIDHSAFLQLVERYHRVHLDIGTGDARYVTHLAGLQPDSLVIGVDACRDGLTIASRRGPVNSLFVAANALILPDELAGVASSISINFPWGSLLSGLLGGDSLVGELLRVSRRPALLEVRLNTGALAEQGWRMEEGAARVRDVLSAVGFVVGQTVELCREELKVFPSSWARRLAYGSDPRGICLKATTPHR